MNLLEPGLALLFTTHQEQGVLLDCAGGGVWGAVPPAPPACCIYGKKRSVYIWHLSLFHIWHFFTRKDNMVYFYQQCVCKFVALVITTIFCAV